MEPESQMAEPAPAGRWKLVLPVVVLVLGVVVMALLVRSRPTIAVEQPMPRLPRVRAIDVTLQDVALPLRAQGTVLPRSETTLVARVSSEVTWVSPSFVVGGLFTAGEVLLALDRQDLELAVKRHEAAVARARVAVDRERAESTLAAEAWAELGEGDPDPLALRAPQIAEAEAVLRAAEADFEQGRLDLSRTRIRAPFAGRLRTKAVDVGQFVRAGEPVASLHAIDYAEVRLPLPDRMLRFLALPAVGTELEEGPPVVLSGSFLGARRSWLGRVVRTEGEIDPQTRLLNVVARIDDPYARIHTDQPPLPVGLFVDAEIAGLPVRDAVLLPRVALRESGRVLIVDHEDRLRWRDVDVVRVEGELAIVASGLARGERVCVSPLDIEIEGMQVAIDRIDGPSAPVPSIVGEPTVDAVSRDAAQAADGSSTDQGPVAPRVAAAIAEAVHVRGVTVRTQGSATAPTVIDLAIDAPGYEARWFALDAPPRFVIDVEGAVLDGPRDTPLAEGPVLRARASQFADRPVPVVRVVLDLDSPQEPQVVRTASGLALSFGGVP